MKIDCAICNPTTVCIAPDVLKTLNPDTEMCHRCRDIVKKLRRSSTDPGIAIIDGIIYDVRTSEEYIRRNNIIRIPVQYEGRHMSRRYLEEYDRIPESIRAIYPDTCTLLRCAYNDADEIDQPATGALMQVMRLSHSITLAEAAAQWGTSPERLAMYERGSYNWTEAKAAQFIEALENAVKEDK